MGFWSRVCAVAVVCSLHAFLAFGFKSSPLTPTIRPAKVASRLHTPTDTQIPTHGNQQSLQVAPSDLSLILYDTQLSLSNTLQTTLLQPSLSGFGLLFGAGLLSSFSPCSLGLLPITTVFLVGSNANKDSEGGDNRQGKAAMYACGSASALTILGLLTAYVGGVFGSAASFGDLPTLMTGMVAVAMGLNLLELVQFSLPSLDFYPAFQKSFQQIPWSVQAFAFGASASLISSPCSSPVLASLLAIVASLGDPTLGALYLFAFSLGYSTPVVVAVSQSLSLASSTRGFQSVNTAFGAALIAFGTYSTLDGAFKMLL